MTKEVIEIELDSREARLVLKYGYPFPEQEKLFEAVKNKSGYHKIKIDKYWLELIVGDLCRSIREVKSDALQEELDALCGHLDIAIKSDWLI